MHLLASRAVLTCCSSAVPCLAWLALQSLVPSVALGAWAPCCGNRIDTATRCIQAVCTQSRTNPSKATHLLASLIPCTHIHTRTRARAHTHTRGHTHTHTHTHTLHTVPCHACPFSCIGTSVRVCQEHSDAVRAPNAHGPSHQLHCPYDAKGIRGAGPHPLAWARVHWNYCNRQVYWHRVRETVCPDMRSLCGWRCAPAVLSSSVTLCTCVRVCVCARARVYASGLHVRLPNQRPPPPHTHTQTHTGTTLATLTFHLWNT
jgi:hypothetical protein